MTARLAAACSPLRAGQPPDHDERSRLVWLKKNQGGSGVGEWWWPEDGSVVDVRDEPLALALLAIPDGGYSKADEPKPAAKAPAAKAAPAPAAAAPAKTAGKDAG